MTKTVTVASVDGGYITTDAAANFANQQAIVKFTLKDANGNDLKASSLTIAAASNRLLKGMLHNIPEIKHSGYKTMVRDVRHRQPCAGGRLHAHHG